MNCIIMNNVRSDDYGVKKMRNVSEKFNICITDNIKFYYKVKNAYDNIPKHVVGLKLHNDFNEPINNLPCGTTHLTFGRDFNQLIDNLPNSITHLTLCYGFFCQSIDKLPNSIKYQSK